ncbi:MAG: phosphoglucomutase/phosphomannomutase family protein [Anaerolineales bacterium]|nr:phosphoglucomutase/phosphomannomutase family protein [Anaerolineales bacterium]
MSIRFGTDGWRAVISDTFTFHNLRLVAQAIADMLLEEYGNGEPEVVIGYDTRFLSDRYAADVARVMAANGIIAWLTRADTPTPAVSYSVVHKKAAAGIVITASHNAPRYNGIKLKAAYGGSASVDQGRKVETFLERNQANMHGPNQIDFDLAVRQEMIRKFDPAWAYYEHLGTLVDLDVISNGELHVVADPMYGSGRGAFKEILSRTRCHVKEIRGEMNPGFGGIHPEPMDRYLKALSAAIQSGSGAIGIATDGDADRIGAMDNKGKYVDAHQIFALVLRYLLEKRQLRGAVVRTVSTTRMIDRIAARHQLELYETPVGFNHIADHMLNRDVLMGGEESGGMSIKGHIPEGDGILMGLLLLEVVADAGVPLSELIQDLLKDVGPAFYERTDLRLSKSVAKKEMVRRLTESAPDEIGGVKVVNVSTTDGVKYLMADDGWLLIRPSGTEPVLRVYAESPEPETVKAMLAFGESVAHSG